MIVRRDENQSAFLFAFYDAYDTRVLVFGLIDPVFPR